MRSTAYLRYTVLGLITVLIYFIQVTPYLLPEIAGALPVPLLPLVVVIAMREGEITGAMFGLSAGLLMDVTNTSAMGFNAVFLLVIGCLCGLLVSRLFNDTLRTALLLCTGSASLYLAASWMVIFCFKGIGNPASVLISYYLPILLYTAVFILPFYYLVRFISRRMI